MAHMPVVEYEKTLRCKVCRNDFTFTQTKGRTRSICSPECKALAKKATEFYCCVCSAPLKDGYQTYCSELCKTRGNTDGIRLKNSLCAYCRTEPRHHTNGSTYCSGDCLLASGHAIGECEQCGKETRPPEDVYRNAPRFCNQTCRSAYMISNRAPVLEISSKRSIQRALSQEHRLTLIPAIGGHHGPMLNTYATDTTRLAHHARLTIDFWHDIGIELLSDLDDPASAAAYFIMFGDLGLQRNPWPSFGDSTPLWNITPWITQDLSNLLGSRLLMALHERFALVGGKRPDPMATQYQRALTRAYASSRADAPTIRNNDQGMTKSVLKAREQWFKRTPTQHNPSAVTQWADHCEYVLRELTACMPLRPFVPEIIRDDSDLLDLGSYALELFSSDEHPLLAMHEQLGGAWFTYKMEEDRDRLLDLDTPDQIGKANHAMLMGNYAPGSIQDILTRCRHLTLRENGELR